MNKFCLLACSGMRRWIVSGGIPESSVKKTSYVRMFRDQVDTIPQKTGEKSIQVTECSNHLKLTYFSHIKYGNVTIYFIILLKLSDRAQFTLRFKIKEWRKWAAIWEPGVGVPQFIEERVNASFQLQYKKDGKPNTSFLQFQLGLR